MLRKRTSGERRQASSEFDSPGQLEQFSMATKKVLACSHSRSLQLLCTAGGNQAKSDARTEFKILERSLKGGVEAGRAQSCISSRQRFNFARWGISLGGEICYIYLK